MYSELLEGFSCEFFVYLGCGEKTMYKYMGLMIKHGLDSFKQK